MAVKSVNVVKAYETRKKYLELAIENLESINGVHISLGNSKMGAIPSFSVLPLITCKNCSDCSKHCYACSGNFNFSNVVCALAENTALVMNEPRRVAEEITSFLDGQTIIYKYFRFNVAGDIFSEDYLKIAVDVAKANPATKILVFTKNFELFNSYLDNNELPKNLVVVFSQWDNTAIDNRHNLPTAIVKVDENTIIPETAYHCSGDCANCLECWKATPGTTRYFDIH